MNFKIHIWKQTLQLQYYILFSRSFLNSSCSNFQSMFLFIPFVTGGFYSCLYAAVKKSNFQGASSIKLLTRLLLLVNKNPKIYKGQSWLMSVLLCFAWVEEWNTYRLYIYTSAGRPLQRRPTDTRWQHYTVNISKLRVALKGNSTDFPH